MEVNLISEILKIGTCEVVDIREAGGNPYLIGISLLSMEYIANYEHLFSEVEAKCSEVVIERHYPDVDIIMLTGDAREALLEGLERKFYLIPPQSKDQLTIILKLTARCNLNCSYCYDSDFRKELSHLGFMSLDDVEKIISMAASYSKNVELILHGGEPTLAGAEYFRAIAEEILPKYSYANFHLSMQTNGMLLTDEYIEILRRNNINVGISYNALYEKLRFAHGEEEKVLKNMEKLKEEGVGFGVIDVLTNESYRDMKAIYEFYKKREINACLNLAFATNEEDTTKYVVSDKSLAEYEKEAENYFRYWVTDKTASYDRYASMYISLLLTGLEQCCHYAFSCTDERWLAVNVNGNIYPCDGDFPDKYLLGNLHDIDSLYTVFNSSAFIRYQDERNEKLRNCEKCDLFSYCAGGCPESDIMKCGSAAEKDIASCNLFRANLTAAYSALAGLSIDDVNPLLRRFIIDNNSLLPSEIQDFLDYVSIPSEKLTYTFKKSLEDEDFELFRVFNSPNIEERFTLPVYSMPRCDIGQIEDRRFEILKEEFKKRARKGEDECQTSSQPQDAI